MNLWMVEDFDLDAGTWVNATMHNSKADALADVSERLKDNNMVKIVTLGDE